MPVWLEVTVAHFEIKGHEHKEGDAPFIGLEIHCGEFEDTTGCEHEKEFCMKLKDAIMELYKKQYPEGSELIKIAATDETQNTFRSITEH